jgi:tRNA G10  N-methylase Trm11
VSDAKEISKLLINQKISAIVTEGTLGPMYGQFPTPKEIEENFQALEKLYKDSFAEFVKFLAPGGRVVLCVPAYRKKRDDYVQFPSLDFATALGYNLCSLIPSALARKLKFLKLTPRGTAIYDRKDQIVAREIAIFEKA